jgi:hypothetical protein
LIQNHRVGKLASDLGHIRTKEKPGVAMGKLKGNKPPHIAIKMTKTRRTSADRQPDSLKFDKRHETIRRGKVGNQPVRYATVSCTCGGENANCFKCDGTGNYTGTFLVNPVKDTSAQASLRSKTRPEVSLANDSRGGVYSIREYGRFQSNPIEDDFDN